MKKRITIRQASLADEPLLAQFYRTAFDNPQFKYPERWQWLHKHSPYLDGNDSLPIWLAVNQGRVLGMSCLMPQLFWIKGSIAKVSWCHDFRVLPECRGMGVGKKLEKARQEAGNVFSLVSSQVSLRIKKKLGYLSRPTFTVYLHVDRFSHKALFNDLARCLRLTYHPKLFEFSNAVKLPEVVSGLIRTVFRIKQCVQRVSCAEATSLSFKPVDSFTDEVNELWDEIKYQFALAVVRDSRYLNWKFVDQPHVSYQRYLVYKDGKLCGVLVFRQGLPPELPIGTISEFYTNQGSDVLSKMLDFAVSTLYRQGSIMIQCSSSTRQRSTVLSRMGFVPIHKHLSAFSFNLDDSTAPVEEVLKGDWLMGLGDQDRDEYPTASHPSLKHIIKVIFGRTPGSAFIKEVH